MDETRDDLRAAPITRVIAERVKVERGRLRLSAAALAELLQARGISWTGGTVAKLESGRRESVSVQELLSLALVLDVPPAALLVDPGAAAIPLADGVEPAPWDALLWVTGQKSLEESGRAWRNDSADLVLVAAVAYDCLLQLEAIDDPAWVVAGSAGSVTDRPRMVRSAELQALQDQERVALLERLAHYVRDLRKLGMTPTLPAWVRKRADEAGVDLTGAEA